MDTTIVFFQPRLNGITSRSPYQGESPSYSTSKPHMSHGKLCLVSCDMKMTQKYTTMDEIVFVTARTRSS